MKINLDSASVSYEEFISIEQYLNINNNKEIEKAAIETAKVKFNDKNINKVSATQFERDTNTFTARYYGSVKEKVDVAPGIYDFYMSDYGPVLEKTDITKFNKILPIHNEIKDIFRTIGDFSKKNNMLIYGQPGNGKTQSIIDLSNTFKDVVFIKVEDVRILKRLKKIKDDIKKVLIFEEFTETLKRADKRQVLNFLDGIDAVPNSISIMSTNYPKELESNIIDRPSRVRHFIEYRNPNKKQINLICEHFESTPDFFYDKDYSVDNIINVINTSKELKIELSEAEAMIKSKRKFLSETFKATSVMGIGGSGRRELDYPDDDE